MTEYYPAVRFIDPVGSSAHRNTCSNAFLSRFIHGRNIALISWSFGMPCDPGQVMQEQLSLIFEGLLPRT
jgi:hypothetical protein